MIEHSEGSGCRRKKILECFGELVPTSFYGKSCDACKHPNVVAKCLGELTCLPNSWRKSGPSPILIQSSSYRSAADKEMDFWNRDSEASFSDEEISESDVADGVEVVNSLTRSKLSSKAGLMEKIECLEQAEALYYQNEFQNKQEMVKQTGSLVDKKGISEKLREASKKRLLNSLKQAQQRLGDLMVDSEASATILESECYQKYGKVGKTFYNSQVACTVRWLSSSSSSEIHSRVRPESAQFCDGSNVKATPPTSTTKSTDRDQPPAAEARTEASAGLVQLETCSEPVHMEIPQQIPVPPIMSFSEFASKNKGMEGKLNLSLGLSKNIKGRGWKGKDSVKHDRDDSEKRMRLQ